MQITNVYGPYQHARGFRLVIRCDDGSKNSRQFVDKSKAEAVKRALKRQIEAKDSVTLERAFEEYRAHMARKGNKVGSIDNTMMHLNQFFPEQTRTVASLTEQYCAARYEKQSVRISHQKGKPVSTETHRAELRAARTFGKWCVTKNWLAKDPTRDIVGVGRRAFGKPQLRTDEGRRFVAKALELAAAGEQGPVAALVALFMSFRTSEIISREVRDLDDNGRYLVIERTLAFTGKSPSAARQPEVPDVLRGHLRRLAEGKKPTDKIFGKRDRQWLRRWVRRICDLAGVPRVNTHGLRGMCSTYAVESGATTHAVAAFMGHSSSKVTERAYVVPGTQKAREQRELVSRLVPSEDAD